MKCKFYLHDANDAACNTAASISGFLRIRMSTLTQIVFLCMNNNAAANNASQTGQCND